MLFRSAFFIDSTDQNVVRTNECFGSFVDAFGLIDKRNVNSTESEEGIEAVEERSNTPINIVKRVYLIDYLVIEIFIA